MADDKTVFVPNGDSRRDTAILLVGTASEFGISQQSIRTTPAGFFITEELAKVLYDETEKVASTKKSPSTKKTSGNRAAKTSVTEKE